MFEGIGGEFVAGDLALGRPERAVDVEDAVSEEFVEDGLEAGSFDEVGEIGAEEVVEVSWVGSGDAVRETEEAVDLEGE